MDLPSSIFAPKKEEFRGEILHYSYMHGDSSERASPLKSSSTSGSTAEPAAGTPAQFEYCDSSCEWRQSYSLKGLAAGHIDTHFLHRALYRERQKGASLRITKTTVFINLQGCCGGDLRLVTSADVQMAKPPRR